jgi:alpha-amylase
MNFKNLIILFIVAIFMGCSSSHKNDDFKTSSQGIFSYENATIYFAMTDRFYDGDKNNNNSFGRTTVDEKGSSLGTFNGGDFKGLTKKLKENYFKDLGINVIWVSAPYEQAHGYIGGGRNGEFAHYGFHGYYALDWTAMDPNFGTIEDFREFVDTAHGQGIRIFIDVVMNHVGYPNFEDMVTYNYGNVKKGITSKDIQPKGNESFNKWTSFVDWNGSNSFDNWWGSWVRSNFNGYTTPGEDVFTQSLMGLPDIRTEIEYDLGLPPILKTKWEMGDNSKYDLPNANEIRGDVGLSPAEYISKWLSAWVYNFGIDGFRIDTAKHVEIEVWKKLKEECNTALWDFRRDNPDNVAANFTDDFYFLGEVWGQGLARNYYFDNGFDSLINFTFQGERKNGPAFSPERMPTIFKNYSEIINSDDTFNVASYISQHDTTLYPRKKLIEGGTFLYLLPGGIKIFYGDETARPFGEFSSDGTMATRSFMNWGSVDKDVLEHFKKIGQFRDRNISVGGGEHIEISSSPLIFKRLYNKNNVENSVLVYIGEKGDKTAIILDTKDFAVEGETLRDAYTSKIYTVTNNQIEITLDKMGIALIERVIKE